MKPERTEPTPREIADELCDAEKIVDGFDETTTNRQQANAIAALVARRILQERQRHRKEMNETIRDAQRDASEAFAEGRWSTRED